jgi:hypothetical protein
LCGHIPLVLLRPRRLRRRHLLAVVLYARAPLPRVAPVLDQLVRAALLVRRNRSAVHLIGIALRVLAAHLLMEPIGTG